MKWKHRKSWYLFAILTTLSLLGSIFAMNLYRPQLVILCFVLYALFALVATHIEAMEEEDEERDI